MTAIIIAILIVWTIIGIVVSSHPLFNQTEKPNYRMLLVFGPILTGCILFGYIFAPVVLFILSACSRLVEKLASWSIKS